MQAVTVQPKPGSSRQEKKPISGNNSDDLKRLENSYETLKDYLKQLEIENQKLSRELELKRKQRAERLQEERESSRDRLKSLEDRVARTSKIAEKQKKFLSEMRSFLVKNEKLLQQIAQRLVRIESAMNANELPVETMKQELLTLLEDLKSMRAKREKALASM